VPYLSQNMIQMCLVILIFQAENVDRKSGTDGQPYSPAEVKNHV
jgi:hypothetical protein